MTDENSELRVSHDALLAALELMISDIRGIVYRNMTMPLSTVTDAEDVVAKAKEITP